MAPLDLARLANMDFIGSLASNRLPLCLLQLTEEVEINQVTYVVTRDTWGFEGPDPRPFPERLIDYFKLNGNLLYEDVQKAAYQADRTVIHMPKKIALDAPASQEQAWSAWLLADAARQAIKETDDRNIHVKLPALPAVSAISNKFTWLTSFLSENRPSWTPCFYASAVSPSLLRSPKEMK
jgi:hypothetical protein